MLRAGEAWAFASWAWDEAEADLIRVPPEGRAVTLRVQPEDGGALPWLYPSLLSCEICHRVPEARALGPRTGQLHHVVDYGGVRADQLLAMDEIGLFDPPIGPLDGLPAIVDPYGAAPVEARARAWLHGNCAHCHQPGGFVPPDSTLDLRVTTPLAEMDACGARKHAGYTTPGEELIVPGDASASHLVQRLLVTGYEKMPPDGAVRVDDAGVGAVTAWIQGLRACP